MWSKDFYYPSLGRLLVEYALFIWFPNCHYCCDMIEATQKQYLLFVLHGLRCDTSFCLGIGFSMKFIEGDNSSPFLPSKVVFNSPPTISSKSPSWLLSQCKTQLFFPFRMLSKQFNNVYYFFSIKSFFLNFRV